MDVIYRGYFEVNLVSQTTSNSWIWAPPNIFGARNLFTSYKPLRDEKQWIIPYIFNYWQGKILVDVLFKKILSLNDGSMYPKLEET